MADQFPSSYVVKASVISCVADPAVVGHADAVKAFDDGALAVDKGIIVGVGAAHSVLDQFPALPVIDRTGHLLCPGFIDAHVHYPQTGMVASHGKQLLDWLENYTFPEEALFCDDAYARGVAAIFLDELLRNGTTSAAVFGSVHRSSTDILFDEAFNRNMRIAAGKSLMDRNVPEAVRDTAEEGIKDSAALIEKWHGKGRLSYAVTPRFAASCTPDQMTGAARLLDAYPDILMQTHLSENKEEIAWIKELFPGSANYLGVYGDHGLLTDRSIFAHCIYLEDDEVKQLASSGASACFCPTSNLFLGSGLFDLSRLKSAGVPIALGTDIGAGTSFSMLQTMGAAYKVCHLQGYSLDPFEGLYHATLAGAKALHQQDKIGSLEVGKEADFLILDPAPTPYFDWRLKKEKSLAGRLFLYQIMGGDRSIKETYVYGRRVAFKD